MADHLGTGADRGQDSDGSSSGSTTLSATSSPGGAGNGLASRIGDGNLSGKDHNHILGILVIYETFYPTLNSQYEPIIYLL